ncbi:hypothetical protein LWF15_25155 [Kineosporia rhizophila]|uniref:hypothetical protein n=1 Tax=Kineosporia TaxID=49184 RepID=UPI001E51B631|nr:MULTISPECIES: hypothetical protein [Kineosporia]MCE0538793.1 hypothetical protein [Kineosporia rhizophila]GLY18710.1 hypothetical protein Kisp01_57240 [Kineosporia sp. NBRC 101677]
MPDAAARASARGFWPAVGGGALIGALACGSLVWHTTGAAFSGSTPATGSWSAGTVSVTDDDHGQATFSTGSDGLLASGQTRSRCITVTYTGSLVSGTQVRLYASAGGALADQLDLTVAEGTGGAFGDCSGFTATSTLYSGTLAAFATAAASFATGVGAWSPTATPASRSYRFTITVRSTPAAQNASASGSFTWEARS